VGFVGWFKLLDEKLRWDEMGGLDRRETWEGDVTEGSEGEKEEGRGRRSNGKEGKAVGIQTEEKQRWGTYGSTKGGGEKGR